MNKKNKKKEEYILNYDYPFYAVGVDSSFKRPGFSIIKIESKDSIILIDKWNCDNSNYIKEKKSKGYILNENYKSFLKYKQYNLNNIIFIREAAINARSSQSEISIFETVGILDLSLFLEEDKEWNEIFPISVKKQLTGSGKATKEEVSKYLNKYIGEQKYECDDESDSIAVSISWLLKNNIINRRD